MWPPEFSGRRGQILVSILVALFGISSWIEVNGLWVELPLLVARLPEQGLLASYVAVLTQAANVGPLLYSFARYRWKEKMPDKFLIHVTMMVGCSSCFLLIWFWSRTSWVGQQLHSTAFLSLAFCLALVDCTSSVLYLPFVGRLRPEFLLPFLFGEGLSGLLPALVALTQGVGGNPECINSTNGTGMRQPDPRFSLEAFFGFLAAMLIISWISFLFLTLLPTSITEKDIDQSESSVSSSNASLQSKWEVPLSTSTHLLNNPVRFRHTWPLIALQALICFLTNGFLPAIQTFSCLAYGNVAYHLSVTLSCLANPVACLLALKWSSGRSQVLTIFTTIGGLFSAYLLSTAIMSPHPPMVGTRTGEALLVISWVLFTGTLSYSKACIACRLREEGGPKGLFRYGLATQLGSCIGAILAFCLANYTKAFVYYVPCSE